MPESAISDFQRSTPPAPKVYQVQLPESVAATDATKPAMFAHWDGSKWGTPSFTVQSARPAHGALLRRKRTHDLLWREVPDTPLDAEIKMLLLEHGPQTFDGLLRLIISRPATLNTTAAQLDLALKGLIPCAKVNCVEGALANSIGQLFSSVATEEPTPAAEGPVPENAGKNTSIPPAEALDSPELGAVDDEVPAEIGLIAEKVEAFLAKKAVQSYRQISLGVGITTVRDRRKVLDALGVLVLAGKVVRAVGFGRHQLGYILAKKATKEMATAIGRSTNAPRAIITRAVAQIIKRHGPVEKQEIIARVSQYCGRFKAQQYMIEETLAELLNSNAISHSINSDADVYAPAGHQPAAAAPAPIKGQTPLEPLQRAADPGQPACAPHAAEQVADPATPATTPDPTAQPFVELGAAPQATQDQVSMRLMMGSLLGGMLDVIKAETARASGSADAKFFPQQDSLRIVQAGQAVILNSDDLVRLKELLS